MMEGNSMSEYYLTNDELFHHGIIGQKWGVRRYQNSDGTYTSEGKARRREDYSEPKQSLKKRASNFYSNNKDTIKKVGKAVAVTAAVGASAYLLAKNKDAAVQFVKDSAKTAVSELRDSSKRVGKAMLDASLMSIGMIEINKLSQKLTRDDTVDERTRNMNQVLFDTASAGIKEATKASGSNANNSNKGGANVGKEITDKLGAPSNKGIDRQSVEYQSLFKDAAGNQRDSATRSVIKSLASAGYDIDQLNEYIRNVDNGTIKHSLEELGYFAINEILYEYAL